MPNSLPFIFALLASAAAAAQTPPLQSVYTELTGSNCKTVAVREEPDSSSLQQCAGVGGYNLQIEDGDDRQSVTVVKPDGSRRPLDLWNTVSGAFSSVGPRAEWRVRQSGGKATPVALIVRFNAQDMPDHPERNISYLVVAKITPEEICVTDKIGPGQNANLEARKAADAAATKPCIKSE
jgi:hypothetical protein